MKKHLRPPPAFQEYASDILSNIKFRRLSLPERGLWQTMRLECWVNKSLPANPEDLAILLNIRVEDVHKSLTPAVLDLFECVNGQLSCRELEELRANMNASRDAKSEGGRRGGLTTQRKRHLTVISDKPNPIGDTKGRVQGDVQADLKLLSRNERSRGDTNKEEFIKKDDSEDLWVTEFVGSPLSGPLDYKSQSSGY